MVLELFGTFENNKIKIFLKNNTELWFKGKEVAEVLGYKNLNDVLYTKVSDKYKKTYGELCDMEKACHHNNEQKVIYINEPGLYELIFSSKLHIAQKFKSWVFEDVLPKIKKHGEYTLKKANEQLALEFEES